MEVRSSVGARQREFEHGSSPTAYSPRHGREAGHRVGVTDRFVVVRLRAAGARPSETARGEPGKPVVQFPSQAKLAQIESQPAEIPTVDVGAVPSEGWKLEPQQGALNPDEPFQARGSWEAAFAADAAQARPSVHLTRALACVAHEAGRFYLDAHAPPPENLQQFIIAACGAVVPQVGLNWLTGPVPDTMTDNDLLARRREQMNTDMVAHLPDGTTDAGFWYGRAHGRSIAIMTYAASRVRWKSLAVVPDAQGNAIFEGELTQAADYIIGYANQGRLGVEHCAIDPGVARPKFRATCHLAKDDDTAWVQLLSAPPQRVLALPFAQILLRRSVDQPLALRVQPYTAPHPVASTQEFSTAVVASLNDVRAQAHLRPVQLAQGESARAMRLADHYFATSLTRTGGTAETDEIALGLLAGWQIEGLIRDGLFTSSVAPHTHDAAQWLDDALTSPVGRAALLAPEIEAVSLGTVLLSQPQGLGAVVTGYRLYHSDDHSEDVRRLYARLMTARRRLGLGMPLRLNGIDGVMKAELARLQSGQWRSQDALQASLDAAVRHFGASMRGYVIETTSLDAFEIPEELVRRKDLYFEIGVGHYRAPGAAWGQMVILVVFADTGAPITREI